MGRHTQGRHRVRTPVYVQAVRIAGAGGLVAVSFFVVREATPPNPKELVAAAVVPEMTAPTLAITTTPIPTPVPDPTPEPVPDPAPKTTAAPVTTVVPKPVVTTTPPPPPPPPPPEPKKEEPKKEEVKEEVAPVSKEVDADPKGNVLTAGMTFVGRGIPYVYGGKTTAGVDCSGFIWMALKKAGYNVPYRNSDALRAWAKPISAKAAKPGDLVFWPGHVGIYAGNGRLVDSGGPPGVVERKMWGSPTYGRIP